MSETPTPSVWEDLIHNQRWEELRGRLAATHSFDIAEALGRIHGKEQALVFRLLSGDQSAQVFSYLPADRQKERPLWDASRRPNAVLEEMPAAITRQLLEVLSPEELKNARQLLGYPEHSVGRYVTPDYLAIRPEMTAGR